MPTTKHNHGPNFGKHVDNCPRCEELKAGAPAVKWSGTLRRERELNFSQALKSHNCILSGCGPVCTFDDW